MYTFGYKTLLFSIFVPKSLQGLTKNILAKYTENSKNNIYCFLALFQSKKLERPPAFCLHFSDAYLSAKGLDVFAISLVRRTTY